MFVDVHFLIIYLRKRSLALESGKAKNTDAEVKPMQALMYMWKNCMETIAFAPGYAWPEDKEHCEECGNQVSKRCDIEILKLFGIVVGWLCGSTHFVDRWRLVVYKRSINLNLHILDMFIWCRCSESDH